ncbi:MAG: hypothetical protein ACK4FF_15500 [Limnobacter sp.]|uniref:hypothetical protein n=1 Tax=Limnobacter sp. TaxID=2003368 RepID=UPI00391C67CD
MKTSAAPQPIIGFIAPSEGQPYSSNANTPQPAPRPSSAITQALQQCLKPGLQASAPQAPIAQYGMGTPTALQNLCFSEPSPKGLAPALKRRWMEHQTRQAISAPNTSPQSNPDGKHLLEAWAKYVDRQSRFVQEQSSL